MIKLIGPSHPSRPPAPGAPRVIGRREERRGAGACIFFCNKALADEIAHMARACAIVNLTTGAGTWATVALEQGLPYFGVALTGTRYHKVMDHLKGEAGSAEIVCL